jgi:hypothetical protein
MTVRHIGSPSPEGLHVIAYRATLDIPTEMRFVVKLLAAGTGG